ncbi:STAS domain-containing protein [Streptomyces sp. NPDC002262]|uniref:STAS domain-containing protein n=1 Tax=Streptomyces sp. NPDC002262 TaxID=3154414 RepID=UPI0033196652
MSPPRADPSPAPFPTAAGGPRIRVEVEATASGTVLRLGGEIDMDTAGQLDAALTRALPDGDAGARPPLLLDLSGVSFCDSTGLNALLRARLRALHRHVPLSITAASEQVAHLLDITRTDVLFGLPSPRGPHQDGRRHRT